MAAHSNLGASNAHRWLVCAGSVEAERGIVEKESPFAAEGTRAHELGELALRTSDTALDAFEDQEMAEYVRVYTDYVRQSAHEADLFMIEQRVGYSDWVDGGFGTADAVIIKDDLLHVCDLKYGMGVRVDAENNPQGMLYALGAFAENNFIFDIKTIKISIIQPRLDHISEWQISVEELLRWAEWVRERAEATQAPDAERTPGEKQCRFCKAKASCKALLDYTEAVIMADFDDLDMPASNTLTDEQMRVVMEAKPLIDGWLSAIEAQIKDRLDAGDGFAGFKLVEGRSLRQWSNEVSAAETLEHLLGEASYTKKLLSPAQAEKSLGKSRKGEIADLITKPAGRPTLAPESDKRPAINLTDDDFDTCTD